MGMMKEFLTANAKDDVFTPWHSLKLERETITKNVDKFWGLYLKALTF